MFPFTRKTKSEKSSDKEIRLVETSHNLESIQHSLSYSNLLDVYVSSIKWNTRIKMGLKIIFFGITMGILIAVVVLFYIAINYATSYYESIKDMNKMSLEAIISVCSVLIPAISSLIVAFIKIPEIIAKYLFNQKEDNLVNSIIKNIQDYDREMYKIEHITNEMLTEQKEKIKNAEDEIIEDAPEKPKPKNEKENAS